MMLLDSDVLVDFMTGQNEERQAEWFKLHPERPHTTALAVAEVLHYVESLDATQQMHAAGAVRLKVPWTGASFLLIWSVRSIWPGCPGSDRMMVVSIRWPF